MDTIRIELGGDYAIVLKEMRHKTTREVSKVLRRYMTEKKLSIADLQKAIESRDIDPEETTEIILLNQVTEWSFGAVTQETLDNITTEKYQNLTAEVDKLYSVSPLPVKNSQNEPSAH
jgi:hypothetical protein